MRIGILATRLSGTDGVSLEVAKWVQVLQRLGHEICYCAGELGGYAAGGTFVPRMHFNDPLILSLNKAAFNQDSPQTLDQLMTEIKKVAGELNKSLLSFLQDECINLIIVENALAIPMNLPLAQAITDTIIESGLPVIAHHHDYFWERERFQTTLIPEFIESVFPPDLPNIRHVSINTIAQRRLRKRRGIDSIVIPNVIDFDNPPLRPLNPGVCFRNALGLCKSQPLIVQPTRVIQRKGIELAIELLANMALQEPALYITHAAGDEGLAYWQWLQHEAAMMGVSLHLVDRLVRGHSSEKIFSLAEMYADANLITYPSLYEGFGNALLESVYYKCPVVVNRYPVYNCDIRPLGFQFIELDGYVNDQAVEMAKEIILFPDKAIEWVDTNYKLAKEHFSMLVLREKIMEIMAFL
jgi:glycosyltransferase involved in cell wall biosynthesis